MFYQSLQKATASTEDAILHAELEVARLKQNLKIHRFFLECHAEKTTDRQNIMQYCHGKLSAMESKLFAEAMAKTSARNMFARQPCDGMSVEI